MKNPQPAADSPCALFIQSRCPHGKEWRDCIEGNESESQREAAGTADERPDGQAENDPAVATAPQKPDPI